MGSVASRETTTTASESAIPMPVARQDKAYPSHEMPTREDLLRLQDLSTLSERLVMFVAHHLLKDVISDSVHVVNGSVVTCPEASVETPIVHAVEMMLGRAETTTQYCLLPVCESAQWMLFVVEVSSSGRTKVLAVDSCRLALQQGHRAIVTRIMAILNHRLVGGDHTAVELVHVTMAQQTSVRDSALGVLSMIKVFAALSNETNDPALLLDTFKHRVGTNAIAMTRSQIVDVLYSYRTLINMYCGFAPHAPTDSSIGRNSLLRDAVHPTEPASPSSVARMVFNCESESKESGCCSDQAATQSSTIVYSTMADTGSECYSQASSKYPSTAVSPSCDQSAMSDTESESYSWAGSESNAFASSQSMMSDTESESYSCAGPEWDTSSMTESESYSRVVGSENPHCEPNSPPPDVHSHSHPARTSVEEPPQSGGETTASPQLLNPRKRPLDEQPFWIPSDRHLTGPQQKKRLAERTQRIRDLGEWDGKPLTVAELTRFKSISVRVLTSSEIENYNQKAREKLASMARFERRRRKMSRDEFLEMLMVSTTTCLKKDIADMYGVTTEFVREKAWLLIRILELI